MASVQLYVDFAECVINEIISRRSDYQKIEYKRHFAALIIQKVFRGYLVRKTIKRWNQAATTIQRWFRGWQLRWHLPEILRQNLELLRWRYYDQCATKIQALWRGYWVRKKIDIKAMIAKRRELQAMNEQTMQTLQNAFRDLREQERMRDFIKKKMKTIRALQNMHHIIRTRDVEGVFSLHGTDKFSDIEKLIIFLSKQKISSVQTRNYSNDSKKECDDNSDSALKLVGLCK
ncbi:spermatogenesis-associated protein 17-like [Agrilus planipennis]|uniref:Spermatogenesis-associated protein 17-like n=1 Tax=Agrilus planipennis TaxID=224129 RepID=A0A1W4XB67_AGRPL|nr:spermatogenesis-associated protein 17-like [Agrilus planipennis]